MGKRFNRVLSCVIATAMTSVFAVGQAASARVAFEKDVRPILREHCLDCHGAETEVKGGLDLRLRRFMVRGGKHGPAIAPGDPEGSLLLQRVRDGEMPPSGKPVPAGQADILERWIQQGAPTARPEPENIGPGLGVSEEERAFWSFQPIRRPAIPTLSESDGARARTPVDAFALRRLRERGISFSPEAGRVTLLRRAYFDLIGLPPSPDVARAFLADRSSEAYERLIDELLKSPHYGERWGRHWLDVAGYADSEGHTERDDARPHAWRYRDYVIKALNEDKPFDRFIVEQFAGDELVPQPHRNLTPEQIELLSATGYLRMAADGTGSGANDELGRNQVVADTLKIVSTSLLGLSVGCAQCHDHRYDPISQRDYYELRAVFEPALTGAGWRTPAQRRVSLYTDADRKAAAEVEKEARVVAVEKGKKQAEYIAAALAKELEKYQPPLREQLHAAHKTPAAKRSAEQKALLKKNPAVNISGGVLYQYNQKAADDLKTYDARMVKIRTKKPKEEFLRVLSETPGKAPLTKIFHRGDPRQPKDAVGPAGLTIAAPPGKPRQFEADDKAMPTSGRRLAYARWLTGGEHPLTARVIVNRVWQQHFGRGLVATPDDFGALGEKPTHPELLDWLADDFMASGWSMKRLHKLIMTSTIYRQSSGHEASRAAEDPANLLYWRKPIVRLEAEIVRDRILAASGALKPTLFGPPVAVKADDAGQIIEAKEPDRRSVYVQTRRSQPLSMLTVFDAPVMEVNCALRPSSTVAPQSLLMMNSEFVLKQAEKMAARALREEPVYPTPKTDFDAARLAEALKPRWQYGYGGFDEATKRTGSFTHFPHWSGSSWLGGPKFPDPKLGFSSLHKTGGHPDRAADRATIRRWIAPFAGQVVISGTLHHPSPNGDGVRGRIVSSGAGFQGEWIAKTGGVTTAVKSFAVKPGEAIDFITDCRAHFTSDSFSWNVTVSMKSSEGEELGVWKSDEGFHGPVPSTPAAIGRMPERVARAWELAYSRPPSEVELKSALDFLAGQIRYLAANPTSAAGREPATFAMANLCQALINSNEFLYVE
jgi:hypothetical protein